MTSPVKSRPSISLHLIVTILSLFAQSQARITAVDRSALLDLRSSLSICPDDWPSNSDDDPCETWTGVRCSDGWVTALNLTSVRRSGGINSRFSVGGLRNLTRLDSFISSGFELSGPIPEWFGTELSLRILDLSFASVKGSIPETLGEMMSLSVLNLCCNSLTGALPRSLVKLWKLTELDLSGNSLDGFFRFSMENLRSLERLNLGRNRFEGSARVGFGGLSELRELDLSSNSFSGVLPEELGNLRRLEVLNLSRNLFTGRIPGAVFTGTVDLSQNGFEGNLPESLWVSPELRFMDLSSNRLTGVLNTSSVNFNTDAVVNLSRNFLFGRIPSRLETLFKEMQFLDISYNFFEGNPPFVSGSNASFGHNCFSNASGQRSLNNCRGFYAYRGLEFNFASNQTESSPEPPTRSSDKSRNHLKYILVGVFGGALLVLVSAFVIFLFLRKRASAAVGGVTGMGNLGTGALGNSTHSLPLSDSFTYDQLCQATSSFSITSLIKRGHSGDLYYAIFDGRDPVVVKRIDASLAEKGLYQVELDFFARVSHDRIVPFLGYYEDHKLLVYKYMPNADLATLLFKRVTHEENFQSLDWITRQKIAIGIAEALVYLHHECVPPLVHRDVQASSILLDKKFEVRLGSLSDVCVQEGDGHQNVVSRILRSSQSSGSSSSSTTPTCAYDTFCFGKVLLELVTGKLGLSGSEDFNTNYQLDQILSYINTSDRTTVTTIVDPSLIVEDDLFEEVWAVAIIAKACLNPRSSRRPTMKCILEALHNPLGVVRDESITGSARFGNSSSRGFWNKTIFGSCGSIDIPSASQPPVGNLQHQF